MVQTKTTDSASAYSGADGSILYQMHGTDAYDNLGTSVCGVSDTNGDASYLNLGAVVSGAGDFDQDGFDDVLLSSRYASPGGNSSAGSAYVYSGNTYALLHRWDGAAAGDELSGSIASVGNVNGNAYPEIIVGAIGTSPGGPSGAGSAYVFGFSPFMTVNRTSVSAISGGTLNLSLTFPTAAALDRYRVLISATGTGPGIRGVEIPLTLDNLVMDTYFGNYPVPNYSNMQGTLDASGNASASLAVPAGIPRA